MLDPAEKLFFYALLDDAAIHDTGRTTVVAGREAVELRISTISWGYPPRVFHDFLAPGGTTNHLLLADGEIGAILRVADRLDGREFYTAEVTTIAYDEPIPKDTFRLDLPGVEFEQTGP